jgi:hypothetical protein
MSEEERFGSAYKPLDVKCLSIASLEPGRAYACWVDQKGRQFYFGLTQGLNRHLHVSSGKLDDKWPE